MVIRPVLTEQEGETLRRRLTVVQQVTPPAAPPPGLERELAQLRALITKFGRSGGYQKVVATRKFFQAMLWLNYPKNRAINQDRVQWWQSAWRDGRWFDLMPFLFDWEGFLRDGQHRCTAFAGIEDPDFKMEIWLKLGIDPASFPAIDTGQPRSPAQNLTLQGIKNGGTVSAIVRFKYRLEHDGSMPDPHLVETLGEAMAGDTLTHALICANQLYRTFHTPQSSGALAYWLIWEKSRRRLSVNEFWDKLSPPESYGLGRGSAIDLLRRKLRSEEGEAKARGQYLFQTQQAAWIILGWNAWLHNQRPSFRWQSEHSLPVVDAKRK